MKTSNQLVIKSNHLTEARYEFNIWETRVFTKMVTMINLEDQGFKRYRIDIKELILLFGIVSNNDYERIKGVPESLMRKIVKIPYIENGKKRIFKTPLVASSSEPIEENLSEGNAYIELSFHPDLKPHLIELKGRFLKYDIGNVLRISSVHSVRIYELLKQYEKIGHRTMAVGELKDLLGVSEKYPLYANFKQKILKKAQVNLEKYTDIYFHFQEIKKGRKVESIKFLIHKNKKNKKRKPIKRSSSSDHTNQNIQVVSSNSKVLLEDPTLQKLINIGVGVNAALNLIQQYGVDNVEQELKHARKELERSYNIKNEPGFILKMIKEQSYTKSQVIKDKKVKVKKRQDAKIKKTHQVKIEKLRAEYMEKRNQKVKEFLEGMTKKESNDLVDKVASPFIKKAIQTAIKNKNKEEEYDLKYSVIAKQLPKNEFHYFEQYLKIVHQYEIVRDGDGEYLKKKLVKNFET